MTHNSKEKYVSTALTPADGWFAVLEPLVEHGGDPTDLHWAPVICWERTIEDDQPVLRAWLNGNPPVRSDQLSHVTPKLIINSYEHLSADDIKVKKTKKIWKEWNWA